MSYGLHRIHFFTVWLVLLISGCDRSKENERTASSARSVTPERWYEEVETASRNDGSGMYTEDTLLRVRVYEDGEVTFQIDKVYEQTTKTLVTQGNVTDLTKVRTGTIRHSLDLPYLPSTKVKEVLECLDKMDEWERAAKQNDLREITKDLPNPWNARMTFKANWYEEKGYIYGLVEVGDQSIYCGHDTKDFRTLLSRLDACVLQAKQKMKGSSEQQELQKKANELLK